MKYLTESMPYIGQISEFVHVKSANLRERHQTTKKWNCFGLTGYYRLETPKIMFQELPFINMM